MKNNKVVIRYAKALFAYALENKISKDIKKDMLLISNMLTLEKEIIKILNNPIIEDKKKEKIIITIFKNINKSTHRFIKFLFYKKRLSILNNVAKKYLEFFEEYQGNQEVKIITPVAITETIEREVIRKIKQTTDKNIQLKNIIDSTIIGGFVLQIGNKLYNASVSNQLKENILKQKFMS